MRIRIEKVDYLPGVGPDEDGHRPGDPEFELNCSDACGTTSAPLTRAQLERLHRQLSQLLARTDRPGYTAANSSTIAVELELVDEPLVQDR